MHRLAIVAVVVAIAWVLAPVYAAHANTPLDGTDSQVAQTTAASCKDAQILKALGDDLSAFGKTFKALDVNKTPDVAKALLDTQDIRRKWEDWPDVPDSCLTLQLQAVIVFGSAGDVTSLILASNAEATNAAQYADGIKKQTDRFSKLIDDLVKLVPSGS